MPSAKPAPPSARRAERKCATDRAYRIRVKPVTGRKAIMGALSLYLDFLNLFTMLLSLLGGRQE